MATRNMRERIPAGPGAGMVVAGTRYVGLLGSEIDALAGSGTHGPGIFDEWGLDPGKRYRPLVTSVSSGDPLFREDGSGEAPASFSALLSIYEDNVLIAADVPVGGGIAPIHTAALSFVEVADDTFAADVLVDVDIPVLATLTFNEPADDAFAASVEIRPMVLGTLAYTEPADDVFSGSVEVRDLVTAALAFVEPADDAFSAAVEVLLTPATPPVGATLVFVEPADDTFAASVTILSTAAGGMLAALAAEHAAYRAASGLFVGANEVLMSAIQATRFYAGWAVLSDPIARQGPFFVTGSTVVTTDEWAIIAPLFRLYVERESAVVLEASRSLMTEPVGRSYAEVQADIAQLEADMPQKAFVEEVFTIGIPADTAGLPVI